MDKQNCVKCGSEIESYVVLGVNNPYKEEASGLCLRCLCPHMVGVDTCWCDGPSDGECVFHDENVASCLGVSRKGRE